MGINKIAIYGDFDCGLWIDGIGTDLDDKELPFTAPPELSARFDVWVSDYTSQMLKNEIDEAAWLLNEQKGRTLAREIKKLAGDRIEVIYGPCRESMRDYIAMPEEVMEQQETLEQIAKAIEVQFVSEPQLWRQCRRVYRPR